MSDPDRWGTVAAWRRLGRCVRIGGVLLAALVIAGCGGGGGGGGGDVQPDTTPPAPGGSSTGADNVPIFWRVLGYNLGLGRANAVVENADGSFVVAGYQYESAPAAANLVFIAKTDARGAVLWERRIPIPGGAIAHALSALPGGGYMLAGTSGSGTAARGFLLQTDGEGRALAGWPRSYGSASAQLSALLPVAGGADGFVAAGINAGKLYTVRLEADGDVVWARNDYTEFCGGGGSAQAAALAATQDGRVALAGRTGCLQWAGVLMKIDPANGNEVWRLTVDDADPTRYAELTAVVGTSDGGLLASGSVGPDCGPDGTAVCDMLVVKTNAAGTPSWQRRYGGAEAEYGGAVALAADGNYLVAGTTRSYGGPITDRTAAFMWNDLLLARLSPTGDTLWQKVKGVRPRAIDQTQAMRRTADGGFVIAGESGGNPLLVKFDRTGVTVDLGPSLDLTVTVPATSGTIGFGNAVEVAGAGAGALLLPPQVGGQIADLLLAASAGTPPAAYCTGGGSYGFAPAVPGTLTAGGTWTLTFNACSTGGGDPVRIGGTLTLRLDAVSGTPGGSDYTLRLVVSDLALTVDEPGTSPLLATAFSGGLALERTVVGGTRSDRVTTPAGVALFFTESQGGTPGPSVTLGSLSVTAVAASGQAVRLATAGDGGQLARGGLALTVSVLQSLDVAVGTLDPSAGVYRVGASDGSRVTVTLSRAGGTSSATLAIDTNGDGTDDGSVSVPWDFIY